MFFFLCFQNILVKNLINLKSKNISRIISQYFVWIPTKTSLISIINASSNKYYPINNELYFFNFSKYIDFFRYLFILHII